jgi:alpha-tubulin suppressor-like RCC1 family protein
VRTDNQLACWGAVSAPPGGFFVQVSAGTAHACGVRIGGTLACWGNNLYQQATPPPGTFLQVSGGLFHTCGVRADGTLTCWGINTFGQLNSPSTL